MNEIKKQWVVKRKHLFGDFSLRHLVLLENGKYYFSNGEIGDYSEIGEYSAVKMINRDLS